MSIWLCLWLILSGALLYFLGWTQLILFKQKQAWQTYAAKRKLRYTPRNRTGVPEISGVLYGYTISLFTGEHSTTDGRGSRKLTAVEVNLPGRLPFNAAVASGGMVDLVRGLALKEEFLPQNPEWDKAWIAAGENSAALEAYLTPERLQALLSLMKTENSWVVFISRNDVLLLRLDTPDALASPELIDKLMQKLTEAAKILELKDGEEARLTAALAQKSRQKKTVTVSSDDPASLALELENEASKTPAEEDKSQD